MIPTSLYIHIPWCIKKCPYCDFNSHKAENIIPEQEYAKALIKDLEQDLATFANKKIVSIFIGGGTPSLFSAKTYEFLFNEIRKICTLAHDIEITLEANPGTVEHGLFSDYRAIGINRLSLGIQSFNLKHLQKLGRIHGAVEAHNAILSAKKAGFDNLNIDIMHSLPGQSLKEGIDDINAAMSYDPAHISWYQLTIEPNTLFYKQRPTLPSEDLSFDIEQHGLEILKANGFMRYEISAFCKNNAKSMHNMNYWLFGDYYGIGAGAHGKLTNLDKNKIYRTNKYRQPKDYLNPQKKFLAHNVEVTKEELIFEFMLNTTRLEEQIDKSLFTKTTLLPYTDICLLLEKAANIGLIILSENNWQVTELGRKYTNNLQEIFLAN